MGCMTVRRGAHHNGVGAGWEVLKCDHLCADLFGPFRCSLAGARRDGHDFGLHPGCGHCMDDRNSAGSGEGKFHRADGTGSGAGELRSETDGG